ncbi:MAG TPA: thioether cross-link-forming SCIFF peptide maturase, partial [Firmicutes bacterium]|nr:thioether cross-link-forming SCIFF peptide maturase [Bacillota bacterium]
MFDKSCVHTFTQGGLHLAVDGNSGAVHLLDAQALALITSIIEDDTVHDLGALVEFLGRNPQSAEVGSEILDLVREGLL